MPEEATSVPRALTEHRAPCPSLPPKSLAGASCVKNFLSSVTPSLCGEGLLAMGLRSGEEVGRRSYAQACSLKASRDQLSEPPALVRRERLSITPQNLLPPRPELGHQHHHLPGCPQENSSPSLAPSDLFFGSISHWLEHPRERGESLKPSPPGHSLQENFRCWLREGGSAGARSWRSASKSLSCLVLNRSLGGVGRDASLRSFRDLPWRAIPT